MPALLSGIFTVGGYTLLSRLIGFLRDVLMAAVLGAGPVADAFMVAFRLPNHFRSIFAEGAFNAAFVPAYARVLEQKGEQQGSAFAGRIYTLLLVSQLLLLLIALGATPQVVALLAPGLEGDARRLPLAIELTRITFPYLLLMTLVTLYGGILNAHGKFAAAAAAPVFLNLSMLATLGVATLFPTAGHAAAWGVLAGGVTQYLLLRGSIHRQGIRLWPLRPTWDTDIRAFFRALGPAVIGSSGLQLALFADTIIASFLATGALSTLYYADRIQQLPIGVIGIAAGTVLLPDMARRLAAGDENGASHVQNRAIEITLILALPCLVAFLVIPREIMMALFMRGAFTADNAISAADTLAAYAAGLIPFVILRAVVASFHARGDTATPLIASFSGVGVNIGLKLLLMQPLAQVGLALGTAAGAWVNVLILIVIALSRGLLRFDPLLLKACAKLLITGAVMALALWLCRTMVSGSALIKLVQLMAVGGGAYLIMMTLLFGRRWLELIRAGKLRKDTPTPL